LDSKLETGKHHRLLLLDREMMELEGVQGVGNFNESLVVLSTNKGYLKIVGEDLHIQNLDLETEKLQLTGLITTIEYSEDRQGQKGKKFLDRLFR
jgi:sporulation protein YabP